ncbi:hypothetical protein BCON_0167g00060 [Botryotinia convoluta]|uniref:NACHT-NTPase and P-loop NTPases N-terminal domain-containing protein n=1 Tax=Botryotinia convoluta TaxID=54673 RepID=A0A4Z1HQN2_9HELO|nr:hypothetical protein BCON_0167g00060 [Botryotinia convoluta]
MAEAAVAAVSLGASVISFIGLRGQILQGCQFICDCFDDINGAPKEILYILEQLKGFEKGLRNFQYTLEKVKQCTDITESEDEIKLALELSELTIKDLQEFVNRYKRNGRNDWWKGFKFAKKKNVFTKYASRLHQAKINIIGIQSRLNLIITTYIQQMILATATTQSTPSASTIIITTQTTEASNGHKVLTSDRAYGDITYAVHESVYAGLDPTLAQMVRNSVKMALKDFNFNNRSDIGAETVSKPLVGNNEQLPATMDCGDSLLDGRSNPRVFQQTTTKSTINAWLATIIIRLTTILQQRFENDTSNSEEPLITSKSTYKIDIRPNYLMQARCYNNVPLDAPIAKACRMGDLSMVRRLFAEGKATSHDMTSSSERRTMSSLLFHVWEQCYCIISMVNENAYEYCISDTVVRLSNLFKVMEYLIEAGIDLSDSTPNHGTETIPLFWRVIDKLFGCHPLVIPYLEQLIRLILRKSIHDPFECARILESRLQDGLQYSMVAQFIPCVQTQEIWPLTAIKSMEDELESSKQLSWHYLEEPPWALLYDPQGLYIQRVLRSFKFKDSTLESYCINIFNSFIVLSKKHDHLYPKVRERIIQCLKAGMKLNHANQRKRIPYSETLYSRFFPGEAIPDGIFETLAVMHEAGSLRKKKEQLFNYYTITWETEDDYILIHLLPEETQIILRNGLELYD